ncbi:hypothetical protein IEQ34_005653 [Dendrobium chrysotoxum]|uniref:Uncharacterized protein n=1 Tax=Dendrobium chrysotoxum TaxID=161865 RepID=A0AAV7HBQ2_DENCH|nr:hypothetical protein IEQ34_005653 [Dendrobium chrysotoxum]
MDVSFSTASFHIPLLFFFSIASFLLVHGELLLPITDTIDIQHHQVHIVHVQKPTVKKFQLFKYRKSWYQSFLPNDTLFSGEPRLVYAYRQVITGFAAWLTQEELKDIESMDGFLLAHQDATLQHRTTYTPKFLGLDRAQGMWYDSGYGQGQIIVVIDSGVKPTHPSFSGHAMPPPPAKWRGTCYWGPPICNNKLIGALGFRGGSSTAPLDNHGHGSHCASIAAGNFVDNANVLGQAHGTAAGIASKAHLAIYKATTCSEILKSMDEGIRNHVDVMSISQGDSLPDFHVNRIVIGSFAAITKDIVTCAAAPNDPRVSSIDNDAPWIITVGAASTDRRITATVKLGDGREFNGESAYQPSNYNSPQLPLVKGFPNVKGKIVLDDSAENNTKTGIHVLQDGGKALVVMGFLGNLTLAEPHVIPAAFVTQYAAQQLTNYATSTPNPTQQLSLKVHNLVSGPQQLLPHFQVEALAFATEES